MSGELNVRGTDVIWVPPSELKANPWNPNRMSESEFELLCRSMEEDGFTTAILVSRNPEEKFNNMIIDGEHRWRAARAINLPEVPVVYREMSQAEMRIATLRHNRARGTEDLLLTGKVVASLVQGGKGDHMQDSLMMDDVEVDLLSSTAWTGAERLVTRQATTPQEVQENREEERRIQHQMKTAQDVPSAAYAPYYHLMVVFTENERQFVERVLGDFHAKAVVELCTLYKAGELEADLIGEGEHVSVYDN